MRQGPKKLGRTNDKRLVGVKRINAEPEDIAESILDMDVAE